MATAKLEPTVLSLLSIKDNFINILNTCRREVNELFKELNTKLADRQKELLNELDNIEQRYNDSINGTTVADKNYQNLEILLKQQKTMLTSIESVASLITTETRATHLKTIHQTELSCYNWKVKREVFANVIFKFNTTNITDCFNHLGNIVVTKLPDYSNRNTPLILSDAKGAAKGEMYHPHGIALDINDNIYITDFNIHKILVFTIEGVFIREFGLKCLNGPHYLCINDNNIYVSNLWSQSVVKLHINGEYINKIGSYNQFTHPRGIDYDSGLLYVCDRDVHRIQIITDDLKFRKFIENDLIKLPYDIKIREDTIYLSTINSFHILAISGTHIKTLPHTFKLALFFTLDNHNNLLMSDNNSIIIISLLNDVIIHTIANNKTSGLVMTKSNKLVNVCSFDTAKLQLF